MIFGYHRVAIMWKQIFPKKEENAYRHIKSVTALSSVQSTAFKEKMKKKLKIYVDKALNQVRGTLAHAVEGIFTENSLKR